MASLARDKGIKGCSASAAATCASQNVLDFGRCFVFFDEEIEVQNIQDDLENLGTKVIHCSSSWPSGPRVDLHIVHRSTDQGLAFSLNTYMVPNVHTSKLPKSSKV